MHTRKQREGWMARGLRHPVVTWRGRPVDGGRPHAQRPLRLTRTRRRRAMLEEKA